MHPRWDSNLPSAVSPIPGVSPDPGGAWKMEPISHLSGAPICSLGAIRQSPDIHGFPTFDQRADDLWGRALPPFRTWWQGKLRKGHLGGGPLSQRVGLNGTPNRSLLAGFWLRLNWCYHLLKILMVAAMKSNLWCFFEFLKGNAMIKSLYLMDLDGKTMVSR